MKNKVAEYIKREALLDEGQGVLVALSGGADSVALLDLLTRLGYRCTALHCNFHLRGKESDRDEAFVRNLCNSRGIEIVVKHFDTTDYAKQKSISIEMAARELRYTFFEEQRKAKECNAIAVAHHSGDNAETFLLNLIRGAGITGLHGILPKNGHIVRPLLCVSRKEIEEYLRVRGIDYVTDSTNLRDEYRRNKIRLQVLPLLAEINPSIEDTINATADRLRQAEALYRRGIEEGIARVRKGNEIDIELLRKETAPSALLHEMLSPLGFNSSNITDIMHTLDGESGAKFLSATHIVTRERGRLIIAKKETITPKSITINNCGIYPTDDGMITLEMCPSGEIIRDANVATLDASKVRFPLTLRLIKAGDRFAPFGMRGTKLVSDYLTDKKRSSAQRERQRVLCDAKGTILWLVGERPAAPFCVTTTTAVALVIKWKEGR